MARHRPRRCPATGKRCHDGWRGAQLAAKNQARDIVRNGRIVDTVYGYKCRRCGWTHLTRHPSYQGRHVNRLVYEAPSVEMQLWAMPPVHRERALTAVRDALRVPGKGTQQSYTNTPAGRRHK